MEREGIGLKQRKTGRTWNLFSLSWWRAKSNAQRERETESNAEISHVDGWKVMGEIRQDSLNDQCTYCQHFLFLPLSLFLLSDKDCIYRDERSLCFLLNNRCLSRQEECFFFLIHEQSNDGNRARVVKSIAAPQTKMWAFKWDDWKNENDVSAQVIWRVRHRSGKVRS